MPVAQLGLACFLGASRGASRSLGPMLGKKSCPTEDAAAAHGDLAHLFSLVVCIRFRYCYAKFASLSPVILSSFTLAKMAPYTSHSSAQSPGWKKSNDASHSPHAVGHRDGAYDGSGKRKFGAANDEHGYGNKKARPSNYNGSESATPKQKKSVTFGETPTKNSTPKEPKKPKGPAKKPKAVAPVDTKNAVEYLRLWKASREAWKFNKNHQSTLIKAVFETGIPPADIPTFYDYIKDIKGFVRTRLRESAMEVRVKDRSEGAAVFPKETPDRDAKQATYETILSEWLQSQHLEGGQKRTFNEAEFITTANDADMIVRRAIKRMRAETIIETLSDGSETDVSMTGTATSKAKATGKDEAAKTNGVPGKRRRKLRVNQGDSDSSSSSESESDSDSGSDTSSSGSSSSESESESDNDDDEEDNDSDSGSSSGSSSSDSSDSESESESESEAEK